VHQALDKLLSGQQTGTGTDGQVTIMYPTSVCNIHLAIPSWKLAVIVGLKEDFFRGPREAWADDSGVGWGRTAETELDHGALPGDFIFSQMDEMDGMDMLDGQEAVEASRFHLGESENDENARSGGISASDGSDVWQRLPALRMRLLKRLGWRIVEVPYFEWRSLLRSEEQSFLNRLLQSAQKGLQAKCTVNRHK